MTRPSNLMKEFLKNPTDWLCYDEETRLAIKREAAQRADEIRCRRQPIPMWDE